MEFTLLHLCVYLVFWWYFLSILAEGLGAALGAFFAQVLGSCFVGALVLAWIICCIVVLVRRVK